MAPTFGLKPQCPERWNDQSHTVGPRGRSKIQTQVSLPKPHARPTTGLPPSRRVFQLERTERPKAQEDEMVGACEELHSPVWIAGSGWLDCTGCYVGVQCEDVIEI